MTHVSFSVAPASILPLLSASPPVSPYFTFFYLVRFQHASQIRASQHYYYTRRDGLSFILEGNSLSPVAKRSRRAFTSVTLLGIRYFIIGPLVRYSALLGNLSRQIMMKSTNKGEDTSLTLFITRPVVRFKLCYCRGNS